MTQISPETIANMPVEMSLCHRVSGSITETILLMQLCGPGVLINYLLLILAYLFWPIVIMLFIAIVLRVRRLLKMKNKSKDIRVLLILIASLCLLFFVMFNYT